MRFVLSPHIPENVLNTLPNDIRFFEEFLDRRLISDQDMGLLRDAFYKIERIDCVHYIDRAKEGQCLLELENAIQGQAVSGATGEIYNQSVTAVQQNRSITDEADHIPGATGFQITSEVAKNSGENFAGETTQLEEITKERSKVMKLEHKGTDITVGCHAIMRIQVQFPRNLFQVQFKRQLLCVQILSNPEAMKSGAKAVKKAHKKVLMQIKTVIIT